MFPVAVAEHASPKLHCWLLHESAKEASCNSMVDQALTAAAAAAVELLLLLSSTAGSVPQRQPAAPAAPSSHQ
jgi:hypothetical protein